MDCFEVLGLPRRLVLGEEEIKEAFHARSRERHPDVSEAGGDFDELTEAYAVLRDPVRRLKHFLEVEFPSGEAKEGRELIAGDLLELFGEVGGALEGAAGVLERRASCRTAMGKATIAKEVTRRQQELGALGARLGAAMDGAVSEFAELDGLAASDRAAAEARGKELARRMSYLAKWIEQVRGRFVEFFEE